MLESIFTKLLILSIQAGFLILATIIVRGIFKRIPRKYICLLWCMAALRLLIPVTIESPVSLVPTESSIQEAFVADPLDEYQRMRAEALLQVVSPNATVENKDIVHTYVEPLHKEAVTEMDVNSATAYTYEPEKKAPDLRILVMYLWIFGGVILLGYGVFTYVRVSLKVRDAVHLEENVWLSDRIDTPFLLGYIKPRIYMPFFVDESRREYIVAHEMGHVKRADHITKLMGYILLAVYWFQPLVWVAYVLFCKDVEMACDEKVISSLGQEKKKAYSQTLLLCSVDKHYLLANPLAFGEIDVKKRITNVLSYKKPGVIVSILSVIVLLLVAVFFMTNGQDKPAGATALAEYQEEYLSSLSNGTTYAVVPLAGAEEPLLLTTTDIHEEGQAFFRAEYCFFEHIGTLEWREQGHPFRADGEALYSMTDKNLTVLTVPDQADPETGLKFFEASFYKEEDEDYEKMLKKYEKARIIVFDGVVENSAVENVAKEDGAAPDKILADYQIEYLKSLESGTGYAVVPLEGAEEPMLLTAKGYYEDPAFDNAKVNISAEYCMFGEVKGISTGGTAYPIRADYEAIYLESGHNLCVLTVSEDVDPETGAKYMETSVYSEDHEQYWEMLERCQAAFAIDFGNIFTKEKGFDYEAVLEEVERNIAAQLESMEEEQEALVREQEALMAFREKYGTPVRTMVKNNTEEEYLSIAKATFDEYNKMDALFSTSLPISGSWDLDERYAEVESDMFPNAKAVKDYMRLFCGEKLAEWHYYVLFRDGEEDALLKEENGKLHTAMFDGIPVAYSEYDNISILEASSNRIVYNIWPSAPFFEERDAVYFVQIVWEDDRWVVEECSQVQDLDGHAYYPETVHSRLDMGDYEVVLQNYTTSEDGPLEVAIIRGDKSESLKILYEEWQRDPATVRVADAGEIFGYDCFYVYDFGLFHTVYTNFYAVVDGEMKHLATSFGDDPENNTFIRDLDGDDENELICNVTYSADGRMAARIYKREGSEILCAGLNLDFLEVTEYMSYTPTYYDEESDKFVVEECKESGEWVEHYLDVELSDLEFYSYTPGY